MYTDFGVSIPAVRVRYMKKKFKFFEMISVSIPAVRVRYIRNICTIDFVRICFNSRSAGKIHRRPPPHRAERY